MKNFTLTAIIFPIIFKGVTVGYQASGYTFSEADGTGTISVAISNPVANPFSITANGGKSHLK